MKWTIRRKRLLYLALGTLPLCSYIVQASFWMWLSTLYSQKVQKSPPLSKEGKTLTLVSRQNYIPYFSASLSKPETTMFFILYSLYLHCQNSLFLCQLSLLFNRKETNKNIKTFLFFLRWINCRNNTNSFRLLYCLDCIWITLFAIEFD